MRGAELRSVTTERIVAQRIVGRDLEQIVRVQQTGGRVRWVYRHSVEGVARCAREYSTLREARWAYDRSTLYTSDGRGRPQCPRCGREARRVAMPDRILCTRCGPTEL